MSRKNDRELRPQHGFGRGGDAMRDMMRDAPTFRPTKAEMADFSAYVSKIMPQAAEFGICKVVPPKSWEGPPTTAPPDDLVIRGAIQQHVMGSHGVYSIVNQVQKQSMSFERFSRQAESFEARVKNEAPVAGVNGYPPAMTKKP